MTTQVAAGAIRQFTFDMTIEEHQQLKVAAAKYGTTMAALVLGSLKREGYIKSRKRTRKPSR